MAVWNFSESGGGVSMAMDLYGSSRDRLFEDDDEEQELGFGSVYAPPSSHLNMNQFSDVFVYISSYALVAE